MRFKKSQAVKLTILVIIGLIALFIFLGYMNKIRKNIDDLSKDECFQQIVSTLANKPDDIVLDRCLIKNIMIDESVLNSLSLKKYDYDFMKVANLPPLAVKLDKVFANLLINCFRKTGSGKLSLFSKVINRDLINPEKSLCIVCSRIKITNSLINKLKAELKLSKIELKDLQFVKYLTYVPSPFEANIYEEIKSNNPFLAFFYFAEENFNFPIDSTEYYVLNVQYGVNTIDALLNTNAEILFSLFKVNLEYYIKRLANLLMSSNDVSYEKEVSGNYITYTLIVPIKNTAVLNSICSKVVNYNLKEE